MSRETARRQAGVTQKDTSPVQDAAGIGRGVMARVRWKSSHQRGDLAERPVCFMETRRRHAARRGPGRSCSQLSQKPPCRHYLARGRHLCFPERGACLPANADQLTHASGCLPSGRRSPAAPLSACLPVPKCGKIPPFREDRDFIGSPQPRRRSCGALAERAAAGSGGHSGPTPRQQHSY